MSIVDTLYKEYHRYTADTGNYPNKIILGVEIYEGLIEEVHKTMALGLTHYPDGSHTKLWGVPITIDYKQPKLVELGEVRSISVGEEDEHRTE